MTQDRASGDKARRFGKEIAKQIARRLGAEPVNGGRSNEFLLGGIVIGVKSARIGNNTFLITNRFMERVSAVYAGLENQTGRFAVYRVDRSIISKFAKPSRSKQFEGRAQYMHRAHCEEHGLQVAVITFKPTKDAKKGKDADEK